MFQKNLDELSARMSTVESVQKSWRPPADVVEANEMQEQLQVLGVPIKITKLETTFLVLQFPNYFFCLRNLVNISETFREA